MKIFFNNKHYNVNKFKSIFSIKHQLGAKNLYFNSSPLEDHKTLYDYKIKPNSSLYQKTQPKGGNATKAVLIVIGVLLLLSYIFCIFLGTIPFFSMLMSNILVKSLKTITEFITKLLDPNNWIRSFLTFFTSTIFPFISYILFYFCTFIITFLVTFWCVYFIYLSKHGNTEGYKAANGLAMITALFMMLFYVLYDAPILFSKFVISIVEIFNRGSAIITFFKKVIVKVNNIKFSLLNAIPFYGPIASLLLNVVRLIFAGLRTIQSVGVSFMQNWQLMYLQTKLPPLNEKIQDMGLEPFIEYMNWAMLPTAQKNLRPKPPEIASLSYSMKFIYFNLLAFFVGIIQYFDICGGQSELMQQLKYELDALQKAHNGLNKEIPQIPNNLFNDGISVKKQEQQRLVLLTKQIANMKQKLKESENKKLLDVDCLVNIIGTSMLNSFFVFLIFLIFFLILLFKPNLLNI